MMIRRDDYMDLLYAGRDDNDVVKVVTGMRRCGKSTLLEMYMRELLDSGVPEECIFHLNLESPDGQLITDHMMLNNWLSRIPVDRQTYLFLDEVQNVDGWERSVAAVGTMPMCDLYITGSNSKMLSSDLSTHISGRHRLKRNTVLVKTVEKLIRAVSADTEIDKLKIDLGVCCRQYFGGVLGVACSHVVVVPLVASRVGDAVALE